MLDRKQLKVD